MSVRRYRLANQPFRRRIPEVFGHTSDDIISTFHEASWLAGPVGLLRARAAQRGLAIIFDVPRAGAIIKHHLTSPNDVRSLWRLPDGVCGLCLARFDDNLRDHERCLWCSDNTICRACHISVHISRDDGRVQACFDPGVWGSEYAYLKMKYPFPESPEGVGYIVVQGCVSCVREESLLPETQIQAHWHVGFRRVLKEMVTDNVKGLMGGYFYREFPRYHADRRATHPMMHRYSGFGSGVCSPCREVTRDMDAAVNRNRVHACTSLQVIAYRQIFRAWAAVKRMPYAARAWVRFAYKACLSHEALLTYRDVHGMFAQVADNTDSDSDQSMLNEVMHVPVGNCRLSKFRKQRIVFRGNPVSFSLSPRALLRSSFLVPMRTQPALAADPWTYIENCDALAARVQTRFRPMSRRPLALAHDDDLCDL